MTPRHSKPATRRGKRSEIKLELRTLKRGVTKREFLGLCTDVQTRRITELTAQL